MPRKQLNVTLSPEQYAAVQGSGCRGGGEGGDLLPGRPSWPGRCRSRNSPGEAMIPAWLLHFILFVTRGKTRPV